MDNKVLQTISYGLYVLSVHCGRRDNACIINTAVQAANDTVTIAVNKANLTCDMLDYTEDFTLSVISEEADFGLFRHCGFQSGRDVEKFEDFPDTRRLKNDTLAVTRGTNAYLSAHILGRQDLGSHMLFIARITDGEMLSDAPSATYAYYHKNIKPAPPKKEKPVWRCRICGYEYEGEELPADFICPICKHGAADFERV